MSDKPREARTIHNFIAGLQLLGDAVVAAGFPSNYDDRRAEFTLDRDLDQSKLAALKALGFTDYCPARGTLQACIHFCEWEES